MGRENGVFGPPSPRPSPPRRGRIFVISWLIGRELKPKSARWRWQERRENHPNTAICCSLSLGERVRVRASVILNPLAPKRHLTSRKYCIGLVAGTVAVFPDDGTVVHVPVPRSVFACKLKPVTLFAHDSTTSLADREIVKVGEPTNGTSTPISVKLSRSPISPPPKIA